MAGLFAQVRLPVELKMKPTNGLIEIQPLEVSPSEDAFFGGYAEDMLADLGADLVVDAPKARISRKIQG
ncbi:MAG TPA: hypothetical protein VHP58_00545 [Alphaproteobacteria bacterium]|nr:hypothetical protein [Alphaproteobacteria bacterium]